MRLLDLSTTYRLTPSVVMLIGLVNVAPELPAKVLTVGTKLNDCVCIAPPCKLMQTRLTLLMLLLAIAPLLFLTVHVRSVGWVNMETLYAPPLATLVAKLKVPSAAMVRLSLALFCNGPQASYRAADRVA